MMERLTKMENGAYGIAGDIDQEIIQRLGRYEDAHEQLLTRQAEMEREMERLREQGKQKSGRFRELVIRKLMNQSAIDLLEG